jgi:uncharacterized protein (DUF1330 family)
MGDIVSTYMIVSIENISDQERYGRYIQGVSSIVKQHGGRYIARGGDVTPFAGEWNPRRVIIIEFDSLEDAQECFNSPDYKQIAPLRETSTSTKALFVEGV